MAVAAFDMTARRRLDDALHEVDDNLHYWARLKRADRPPNGWPTEWPPERYARGPRSTAPAEIPERFMVIDAAVAKCTGLEQSVLSVYYVRYFGNTKHFMRRKLNMSEGKWDRTLRNARATVAGWL